VIAAALGLQPGRLIPESAQGTVRCRRLTRSINVVLDATSSVIFVRLVFLVPLIWCWRPEWFISIRSRRCSRRCWRVGYAAAGPVPEGQHDRAEAGAGAAVRGVLEPVPVAVGAGGG